MLHNNLPSIQYHFNQTIHVPNMVEIPYDSERDWIWPCFFDEYLSNVMEYLESANYLDEGSSQKEQNIQLSQHISDADDVKLVTDDAQSRQA